MGTHASAERDHLAQQVHELTKRLEAGSAQGEVCPVSERQALEQRLSEAAVQEQQLSQRLQEVEAQQAQSEGLSVQLRVARKQLSSAQDESESAKKQLPESPSPEVEDLRRQLLRSQSEREVVQNAFSTQMPEAQRNLSRVTMECESLKQQLADVQLHRQPGAGDALLEASRQLQQCEEEKQLMLGHMREHITQLARENYDLKQSQGRGQLRPTTKGGEDLSRDEKGNGGNASWLSVIMSNFESEEA